MAGGSWAIRLGPLLPRGGLRGTGIITVPTTSVITCNKGRDVQAEPILEIKADLALAARPARKRLPLLSPAQ